MGIKKVHDMSQFTEDYTAAVNLNYYYGSDDLLEMVNDLFDSSSDIEDMKVINLEASQTTENVPISFWFAFMLDDDGVPYIEYRGYL